MKNVLLTTTALVITAGMAAAGGHSGVSFGGTAQVSVGSYDDSADTTLAVPYCEDADLAGVNCDEMHLNTYLDLNVSISASTDNGLTVATSLGYDAGVQADYNDDFALESKSGAWGSDRPELSIGYEGFTITAQEDGVDNLYDDGLAAADIGLAGSMGGVSFAITGEAQGDNPSSYKFGYSMGDIAATVTGTSDEGSMKIALSYTMGDITLNASTDNAGDADTENSVGIAYKMGDLGLSYTMAGPDMGDEYDLSVSYGMGPLSASFATNEDNRTRMVAEYDLGGATAFFSSQQGGGSNELQVMGINFAF
jgi:outer membrane protein OmpU